VISLAELKTAIRHTRVWQKFGGPVLDCSAVNRWLAAGRPAPVPHPVKVRNIMTLADIFDANVFVETGTFRGMMIDACLHRFRQIHSVEIYRPLADDAKRRFAPFSHVRIHEGDSGDILGEILPGQDQRIIFWLDGHYSGEGTGKGPEETPVLREIAAIRKYRSKPNDDIILIDDARCFNGSEGYPVISEFMEQLESDFGVTPYVVDDAIILLPKQ
jgi:hypothetical protein